MTVALIGKFFSAFRKHQIAECRAKKKSDAQPTVVRHKSQHQNVGDCNLHQVQERLNAVITPSDSGQIQMHNIASIGLVLTHLGDR